MSSFVLTQKALADLRSIAIYTDERWGREQRVTYIRQLDSAFHRLADTPALGRACDEIMPGYRKFLQGRHVIFYKAEAESIIIVRILHQSSDVTLRL